MLAWPAHRCLLCALPEYPVSRPTLLDHDPTWPRTFAAESRLLASALGPAARAIHHIGSTAVPGLPAKPIIDILIEASSLEDIDSRTAQLVAQGYAAMGEYGIPGRRYFRKDDDAGVRRFHVHVFREDSAEGQRHLAFRDHLRAHPEVAAAYGRLKASLARQHPDYGRAYTEGKAPFIEAVLREVLGSSPPGGPSGS